MRETSSLRPVAKEDLFQLRFLQSATLSPDGTQIAYVVAQYDKADDADYHHIWLYDRRTKQTRQITHGRHQNTNPQWSPDGKQLAFLSTRGESCQVYLMWVDGGEAWPLTNLQQGVGGGPAWSPDGQRIAFSAGPPLDKAPIPDDPYRVTRPVYRFDSLGYLDGAVHDLYLVDVADGAVTQLTADAAHNTNPQWSPDGTRILYTAAMLPDTHKSLYPVLRLVTPTGEVQEVVGMDWGSLTGSAAWLSDGQRIAFAGTPAGRPIGSKADLYVLDVEAGGEPENRTAGLKYGVGGRLQPDMPSNLFYVPNQIAITSDGKTAFLQVQIGGTIPIFRVALEGAEEYASVIEGPRTCILQGLGPDGHSLLYAVSSFNEPLDLYLAQLGATTAEERITALNEDFLAGIQKPVIEHLWFPSQDGVMVEGWFIRPAVGSTPYPTVLYIHGGPHSAFGSLYHFDTQMLVGAGYAVLMINHRASTGYGDEFSTAIKGDWGNLDYADLMAGVDTAIARGWADPDRLGVCGLSGGGNLSCWIVGHTDRFKAAVPENPVTNWVSFYGTSDIGVWFAVEELGGHPHEIPEVYARCSPITYAHRCTTPTLLIQGESDWRCPAEQSEQFYSILKAKGCVVEMVRFPNSPHGGAIRGVPKVRRAQNDALLDWMQRYV